MAGHRTGEHPSHLNSPTGKLQLHLGVRGGPRLSHRALAQVIASAHSTELRSAQGTLNVHSAVPPRPALRAHSAGWLLRAEPGTGCSTASPDTRVPSWRSLHALTFSTRSTPLSGSHPRSRRATPGARLLGRPTPGGEGGGHSSGLMDNDRQARPPDPAPTHTSVPRGCPAAHPPPARLGDDGRLRVWEPAGGCLPLVSSVRRDKHTPYRGNMPRSAGQGRLWSQAFLPQRPEPASLRHTC